MQPPTHKQTACRLQVSTMNSRTFGRCEHIEAYLGFDVITDSHFTHIPVVSSLATHVWQLGGRTND